MLLRSLPARRLGIRRIVPVGKAFAVYKVRADWADDDVDVAPARSSSRSTGPERRVFELRAYLRLERGDRLGAIEELETAVSIWPVSSNRAVTALEDLYRSTGNQTGLGSLRSRLRL